MSHLLVHVVFATHDRAPLIGIDLKAKLHAYMAGIIRNQGCYLYALDGVADHVHVVIDLPPKIALSSLLRDIKSNSTSWARAQGFADFRWQRGFGAFSMNHESLSRAIRYVQNQEAHHATKSFIEELEVFLKAHGMARDEEFLSGIDRNQLEQR